MLRKMKISRKIMALQVLISIAIILAYALPSYFYFTDLKLRAENDLKNNLKEINDSAYKWIETSINESLKNTLKDLADKTLANIEIIYLEYKAGKLTQDDAWEKIRALILKPRTNILGKSGYLNTSTMKGILNIHPFREEGKSADANRYAFMKTAIKKRNGYIDYLWENPDDNTAKEKGAYFRHFDHEEPFNFLLWVTAYKDELSILNLIATQTLSDELKKRAVGKHGYNYVLDKDGKIVYHPKMDVGDPVMEKYDPKTNTYFIKKIFKKKNGAITYWWKNDDEPNPRKKFVYFRWVKNVEWIVASGMYYDELYEPVRDMEFLFISAALVILAAVFIVSFYFGRSISKPIKQLDKGAQAIGKGNLEVNIDVDSEDEIGSLAKNFNDMAKNLKTSSEELQKQRENAEEANRVKTAFLSNMNHEIRSPLASIIGNTDLLLHPISNEEQNEFLHNIRNNGITLKALIDNILAKAELERTGDQIHLKLRYTSIYKLLQEIQSCFSYQARRKRLNLETDIDPAIPAFFELDKVRITQVLINLTGNAVKYTDKGSVKLIVRTKTPTDKQTVDLVIQIEDTGKGIAEKDISVIFERFERRHEGDGTGLGLAISKDLVNLMNGEISVESEEGKGSTFTVILKDVSFSEKNTGDKKEFENRPIEFKGQTVLIVDDRDDHRAMLSNFLKGTNLNVPVAEDGERALQMIQSNNPDLVIMDLNLGWKKIDGVQVTEEIRKREKENDKGKIKKTAIIALTASQGRVELAKCSDIFDRCLMKPIFKEQFIFEVFQALKENEDALAEPASKMLNKMELTPELRENLPGIIRNMEELLPLLKKVSKAKNLDEYELFGEKVKETGIKFAVQALTDYGEEIVKNGKQSLISRVEAFLNDYPAIIEKLKVINGQTDSQNV